MLSWLPIIGPIIDGIVSIFTKFQDTKLGIYKVDGTVNVSAMQTSQAIIQATQDQIGVRIARDLIILPWSMWIGAIGWDYLVVLNHPTWTINVKNIPAELSYMPLAVITFLLGYTALYRWIKR